MPLMTVAQAKGGKRAAVTSAPANPSETVMAKPMAANGSDKAVEESKVLVLALDAKDAGAAEVFETLKRLPGIQLSTISSNVYAITCEDKGLQPRLRSAFPELSLMSLKQFDALVRMFQQNPELLKGAWMDKVKQL